MTGGATVGWRDRAGSWLGIGSSPAALVLGSGLAARHGGTIPAAPILVGVVVMVAILAGQGMLGLAPPHGSGSTLTSLASTYLPGRSRKLVGALLALAMIGWFGFNIGLGGAALATVLGLPEPVGALLLGIPVWAVSGGGMRRWNGVAVLATGAALSVGAVIAFRLGVPRSPVSGVVPSGGVLLADLAGFVGYVSVFGVRAPDFSVGLRRPWDLGMSIGLLVGPFVVMVVLGGMLYGSTGSTDLVGTLSGPTGSGVGNVLVAVAVIGPAFTTTYSGALALRSLVRWSDRRAIAVIAVPGTLLAVLRFDEHLLPWLSILAAALPSLIVPMAFEGRRRRRGRAPRIVPVWTWAPASTAAVVATLLDVAVAPVLALLIAGGLTTLWSRRRRVRPSTGGRSVTER